MEDRSNIKQGLSDLESISSSGEQSELKVDQQVHVSQKDSDAPLNNYVAKDYFAKVYSKIDFWFKKNVSKYISISFFVMLILSFMMWYMIKLSYTYVAEIPVNVNVEGQELEVRCVAEGQGYTLLSNKFNGGRTILLRWSDLEVTPSATNPGRHVISTYSLQNAISVRKPDVRIISMGAVPEVTL